MRQQAGRREFMAQVTVFMALIASFVLAGILLPLLEMQKSLGG